MSGTPKINIPDTPKNKDPNKLPVWHGQQKNLFLKDGVKLALPIDIYTINLLKNLINKICGLLYLLLL